jgi:hypothetical protein
MAISPLSGVFAALLLMIGVTAVVYGFVQRAPGIVRLGAGLIIVLSVSRFFFLR